MKLEKYCIMTTLPDGRQYYDKIVLTDSWETAEWFCGSNEIVHGKFICEVDF